MYCSCIVSRVVYRNTYRIVVQCIGTPLAIICMATLPTYEVTDFVCVCVHAYVRVKAGFLLCHDLTIGINFVMSVLYSDTNILYHIYLLLHIFELPVYITVRSEINVRYLLMRNMRRVLRRINTSRI
jgi:hypothetical protein